MPEPSDGHLAAVITLVSDLLERGPLIPRMLEENARWCGRAASDAGLDFPVAAQQCSGVFTQALDLNPLVGESLVHAFVAGYDEPRPLRDA